MSILPPVYQIQRHAASTHANRWEALPLTPPAGRRIAGETVSTLWDELVDRHGKDLKVGLVFFPGLFSVSQWAQTGQPSWVLAQNGSSQVAEYSWQAEDLFWNAALSPAAWMGTLEPSVGKDLPEIPSLVETARLWMLASWQGELVEVQTLSECGRMGLNSDAFAFAQNALIRRWLDSGDPQGLLPRIRQSEAAYLQRAHEETDALLSKAVESAGGQKVTRGLSPDLRQESIDPDALAAAVAEVEAVSLDIFDTVLMRRVARPVDAFWLLGQKLQGENGLIPSDFVALRVRVEHQLRAALQASGEAEDVTLDAIWHQIGKELELDAETVKAWTAEEIALEEHLLVAHPEFLQLRERIRPKVKRCLSEMYLPVDTLQSWVREKAGLQGVEVWASGDFGLSKGSGRLFEEAAESLQLEPARILHIGDNPESDVSAARKAGWHSFHWQARRSCRLDQPERWEPEDPLSSIALGLLRAERKEDAPLSWQLGFELLGPVVWSWIHHLCRQSTVRDAEHVWLLARDGYWLEKIWTEMPEAWHPGGSLRYVWASRQLWGLATIEDITAEDWDFLLKAAPDLKVRDFFERAGIETAHLAEDAELPWDRVVTQREGFAEEGLRDALYQLFVRHIDAFHAVRGPRRERVLRYLQSLNPDGQPTVMIDLGWHGSSAAHLNRLFSSLNFARPHAQYFASWREALSVVERDVSLDAFFSHLGNPPERMHLLRDSVDLLEGIFSAPHGTVTDLCQNGVHFSPVEAPEDPRPASQLATQGNLWDGAAAFCRKMTGLVPAPVAEESVHLAERALQRLLRFPSQEEARLLADWRHIEAWGVDRCRPLINPDGPDWASHWPQGHRVLLSEKPKS